VTNMNIYDQATDDLSNSSENRQSTKDEFTVRCQSGETRIKKTEGHEFSANIEHQALISKSMPNCLGSPKLGSVT